MNNKGFIATSLIYSFFLIFITLFLTIIADYLQNKVLLNTIEGGIKDTINTTKSIEDFDVGDIVNFYDEEANIDSYSDWVVSKVDFVNKKLVLYSHSIDNAQQKFPSDANCGKFTYTESILNYNNLVNDIDLEYKNTTYKEKLIYDFWGSDETQTVYKLANDKFVSKNCSICTKTDGTSCSRGEENCSCTIPDSNINNTDEFHNGNDKCILNNDTTSLTRKRIEITLENSILERTKITGSGTFILKCN